MKRAEFHSGFADELNNYLDDKVREGYKETSFYPQLKVFDNFCCDRGITDITFTRQDADAWSEKRPGEAAKTHYSRVNLIKLFLNYIALKGYDVCLLRDVTFKATGFQPHIYTEDEIQRYFLAVDTYESRKRRMNEVQFPVLFRMFYGCGTRVSETLGIKKSDVNLDDGIIRLNEAKNNNVRYIVLGEDMSQLLRLYAGKTFYLLEDDDYIFAAANGGRRDKDWIYRIHRMFLQEAGIPFSGNGEGPRVHDWRHTFAVHSFKRMIDQGMDMYVALPVLSTYLGHKTIYATERYVRLTMSLYPYIEECCKTTFENIFGKEFEYHEEEKH